MSVQLKAGVIGLGILKSGHVQFLAEQPEVAVKAVTDVRGERAQEVGERTRVVGLQLRDYWLIRKSY